MIAELENQISIKASGFMQDYKIDISFNSKDTIGILTSYIYEISQERPNKSDRQKFKDRKITKKEIVTFLSILYVFNTRERGEHNDKYIILHMTFPVHPPVALGRLLFQTGQ